jgi:hypothetical protein
VQNTELEHSKSYSTPMEVGSRLTSKESSEAAANATAYRSIVGGLLYAATLTRPDITYATKVVSRFMSEPKSTHLKAAKRIVQYLKGNNTFALKYHKTGESLKITAYSDADFAGDVSTRKSTTGYIVLINNQPVSWRSAKQTSVSTSTVEAEYLAASLTAKESMWIKNLVEEIITSKCDGPILLHVDNAGAKTLAEAKMINTLTKHIDVSYHLIRHFVQHGQIKIISCDTKENIADIFTKPLSACVLKIHLDTILQINKN